MKRSLFFILVFSSFPFICFPQSPGGVSSNLRWWLKANSGVYVFNGFWNAGNGDDVQQWNDQSGNYVHARQTTNSSKPTLATNVINGNPTLRFTGNTYITALDDAGVSSNNSFILFLVLKQNSYLSNGTVADGEGSYIVDRTPETDGLMSFKISGGKFTYQKRNNSGNNLEGPVSTQTAPLNRFNIVDYYRIYNSEYGIHIDGKLDATTTANAGDAITGANIRLGRHAINANQGLNGDIAEVILYNRAISLAERRRVESYLAIKYGIALDQTTLTDYVNSGGNVVYPVASNAGYSEYRYNIAGLARDNNSGLTQSNSRSHNTGTILHVYSAASLSNNDYLVWGSNDGSLTAGSTDVDGTVVKRRLRRVWRVAETGGNSGTVSLEFNLSNIPGAKYQSDLRLLIDRDGDGFYDNDVTPVTGTLSGSIFTVNYDLQNGDRFTIGTTDHIDTPLPVELSSFEVSRTEENTVVARWVTASEKNNELFVLQRSLTAHEWQDVVTVPGHGTTQERHVYRTTDNDPYEGMSYYRLKQSDFDGTITYSRVRSMDIPTTTQAIQIYPNPGNGRKISFRSPKPLSSEASVTIYNGKQQFIGEFKPVPGEKRNEYHILPKERLRPGMYIMSFPGNTLELHKVIVTE